MKLGMIKTTIASDKTVMITGCVYGKFKDSDYHRVCEENDYNFLSWSAEKGVAIFSLFFDHEAFANHALDRLRSYAESQQKNKLAYFAEYIENRLKEEFKND